jgi:hypothetical protein
VASSVFVAVAVTIHSTIPRGVNATEVLQICVRYVKIEFEDEEQYERVSELKDAHGLTWKGLLLRGTRGLDSGGPLDEN